MGCPSSVTLGNSMVFSVTTHIVGGGKSDADAPPTYRVYENETATAILTGTMAKLDDGNTTGFYTETLACTIANGFEADKTYTVYIEAAVDSVNGADSYGFMVSSDSTSIASILAAVDLEVAAIKAQTDQLSFSDGGDVVATLDGEGVTVSTGSSLVLGRDAESPVSMIDFVTYSSGTIALIARVIGWDGEDVTQADVTSISYTVWKATLNATTRMYDLEAVSGFVDVAAVVAECIYDTLQSDSLASEYNFKLIPQVDVAEAFPDTTADAYGYSTDRYEVWVTLVSSAASGMEDQDIMIKFRGTTL